MKTDLRFIHTSERIYYFIRIIFLVFVPCRNGQTKIILYNTSYLFGLSDDTWARIVRTVGHIRSPMSKRLEVYRTNSKEINSFQSICPSNFRLKPIECFLEHLCVCYICDALIILYLFNDTHGEIVFNFNYSFRDSGLLKELYEYNASNIVRYCFNRLYSYTISLVNITNLCFTNSYMCIPCKTQRTYTDAPILFHLRLESTLEHIDYIYIFNVYT